MFIFYVEAKPVQASNQGIKIYKVDNTLSLTLTFEHVTWKSIGIIYLLGATPAPSLVLIKWRGQKTLNGQHSGLEKSGLTLTFEHNRDHLLI